MLLIKPTVNCLVCKVFVLIKQQTLSALDKWGVRDTPATKIIRTVYLVVGINRFFSSCDIFVLFVESCDVNGSWVKRYSVFLSTKIFKLSLM